MSTTVVAFPAHLSAWDAPWCPMPQRPVFTGIDGFPVQRVVSCCLRSAVAVWERGRAGLVAASELRSALRAA
jgi:hypothetical protein